MTTAEGTIGFIYDAAGTKLQKKVSGDSSYIKDYVGGIEYKDGKIEAVYNSEGRFVNFDGTWLPEFYLKDHLGNVRVVVDGSGEVLQYTDNYPFGLEHNKVATFEELDPKNNYKYNGKEWNDELGLLDYGARWYDPAIGRWGAVDPLAEVDHSISMTPYHYVANNPVGNIDPDGMDWFRNSDGEEYWADRTEAEEGETHLGRFHIVEGKTGYVIHDQNQVIGTVSKDGGTEDEARAMKIRAMSVSQGFDNPHASRELTNALLHTGDLVGEALLTYSPGIKGGTVSKGFSPKSAKDFIKEWLSNPKLISGKSAVEIATKFKAAGYNVQVQPLRTGRGDMIIIRGHKNIQAIKVHNGGGRHKLPRIQITGNIKGKKLSIKIVQGSKSQYKGNITEETTAGTKFIFTQK